MCTCMFVPAKLDLKESIDSLRRDGADMPIVDIHTELTCVLCSSGHLAILFQRSSAHHTPHVAKMQP